MDFQTSFLGYRPTIAELILSLILALSALGIWKQVSRAWDYLLDQIAARSKTLREKRIFKFEQKIKDLQNYDLNEVLLRVVRSVVGIGMLVALSGVFVVGVLDFDMKHSLQQLKDEIQVPGTNPNVHSFEGVPALFYVAIFTFIFIVAWLSITTLRRINELIDPANTIKRLEARILALRTVKEQGEIR
jgi:hypothetical protein